MLRALLIKSINILRYVAVRLALWLQYNLTLVVEWRTGVSSAVAFTVLIGNAEGRDPRREPVPHRDLRSAGLPLHEHARMPVGRGVLHLADPRPASVRGTAAALDPGRRP
jgi:hypothetical protein